MVWRYIYCDVLSLIITGSQKERATIRQELYDEPNYNVLVTTYNLANGDKYDKKFLKERKFDVCDFIPIMILSLTFSGRCL